LFYILWPSFYAFFVASAANYLNWQLTPWILRALKVSTNTLRGMALAKSAEAMVVVGTIIILMPLSGVGLASIYIHPGAVLPGVAFGLLSLAVFGLLAVQQGKALHIKRQTIIILLPWIATFVCANALMEELWFRGIFLKGFELALGPGAALLLTAIIFTLAHIGAAYLSGAERIQFLVVLFPLAIVWGYCIQKTGSLLGSVISHAGADLLVLNGFIAALDDKTNSTQE
jgi:membrane protease YdiL (CAAX protease family)